jgi:hypothetical protein
MLKFLIGLFMERPPHFTRPSQNNKIVTHKVGLLIGVYSGREIPVVHYGLTGGIAHGRLRGKWLMSP